MGYDELDSDAQDDIDDAIEALTAALALGRVAIGYNDMNAYQ